MARPRNGTSAHTRYRHAREHHAELAEVHAKLARSRPRTPGKKAANTRALNKISRQLSAARGALTKARSAVAQETSQRAAAKGDTKDGRSAAARKGWATRRKRSRPSGLPPDAPFMPHLTYDGPVWVYPVGNDRSLEGGWMHNVKLFLENQPNALDDFEGKSIFDVETQQRLPFVTNRSVILQYEDAFDFGPSFYKRRSEVARFAA
jgi:hypothetical protein